MLAWSRSPRVQLWRRSLSRLFFHMQRGHWRLIADRITTQTTALQPGVMKVSADTLIAALPHRTVLVIDHLLGGGANQYRDNMVAEYQKAGRAVLLWTFVPMTFRFKLQLYTVHAACQETGADWKLWERLANCGCVDEVIFNNGVTYPEPELLPERLIFFKSQSKASLTVLVHDFFMVCPSHFLLNNTGSYCGLPDDATCNTCLPACKDPLVALCRTRDITAWRAAWGRLLYAANRVICFSRNTRSLLIHAFPRLAENEPEVHPHSVCHMEGSYSYPRTSKTITIAMVGNINRHKGSEIFTALLDEIDSRTISCNAFVIGTLNGVRKHRNLVETGPYHPEQLPVLLNNYGIHLVLMLSIWPETFSYVTHELITLGVPVLSFDIGAQGDAVHQYKLGRTIPLQQETSLLDEIINFKKHLDQLFPS